MKICFFILIVFFCSFYAVQAQTGVSETLLKQHVYALAADSMLGRGLGAKESINATNYIIQQFEAANIKPYKSKSYIHSFSIKMGQLRASGNNVIGIIEGADPILKNEFIVVGAHYDHIGYETVGNKKIIYNGADDNASGTSMLIEIGRELVKNKALLKRSVVIVAFDGEESGLIGSGKFISDSIFPARKIKAMFSLDMVGMLSKYGGINLKGSSTLENGNDFFLALAAKHGIKLKKLGSEVENRTDTDPFGKQGIPAFAPTTGTVSPYHKPEDDADLLDYPGMATIANYLLESIQQLANKETLNANFSFAAKANKKKALQITAGLQLDLGGNNHNYPDDFFKAKPIFAGNIGFYAKAKLSKNLALQPEILYAICGSKMFSGNMRTQSVHVPINLMIKLFNKRNNSPLNLVVGGYYAYHFAGKIGSAQMDFDKIFNRNEYGLNYGIQIDAGKIQLGFMAKRGLSNLFQKNIPDKIYYQGAYFTMGYKF